MTSCNPKTMRENNVYYSYCHIELLFLLNEEYEVSATHRFCPDIVTTLSVDDILLERKR